ncbi:Hypothetical protein AA314_02613 [Archangium gephyra]|uniref:Uncharacterized protein n=1 Tax=Archangium gephyra TaxID=48 RepID=A0AAC8TCQ0_9BACT|nr:Hypothetical protein AA314_02613 [Archangium gephyra]
MPRRGGPEGDVLRGTRRGAHAEGQTPTVAGEPLRGKGGRRRKREGNSRDEEPPPPRTGAREPS